MADSIQEQIVDVFEEWGLQLKIDMQNSINKEVKHGGGQESELAGSVDYKVENRGGVISFRLSMNKYWKWFDSGRRKGLKGPPLSVFGKEWQDKKKIDARKVLTDMSKGKITSKTKLNYEKSVKTLAFLIQRSIKRNGIEPRPFYDRVVTDERIQDLKDRLAPIIKKQFTIDLTNGINNK